MSRLLFLFSFAFIIYSCQQPVNMQKVETFEALQQAIANAQPGDEIVMANGVWKDVQIKFTGQGTENAPIILRAETPGEVFIEGASDLKFGGEYLTVNGLYFRNGQTPSKAVIEFRISKDTLAYHCRVTECVIEDYNQLHRDHPDHWVEFWGRHNQLDHCYLGGKSNQGPTVRVYIKGNESIRNYHQVVNNHFGPRPRKGGPRAETMQIGDSYTSMSPCNMSVANNLFERCNGEVEVISSKTNFNEFRNNVFYKCEGSLVTRHGNYCIIDGNYFIGDESSENIGGIRIINTGHWVTNNYFLNLKGKEFRSPLAVMNGIPKSPLNRYNQVTDVVVAHNTWINCSSPWQFGVGQNLSQKEVLPPSEIRSARPIRTTVANNVIYNETGDPEPIIEHDKADGVKFANNFINNQEVPFEAKEGLDLLAFGMTNGTDNLLVPGNELSGKEVYNGFDFETIEKDIFGNSRSNKNVVGAICQTPADLPDLLDKQKYGPSWYSNEKETTEGKTHEVSVAEKNLATAINAAEAGDIIELKPGIYQIDRSLAIDKKITLRSANPDRKAMITFTGDATTPLFEMNPKGHLVLENLFLKGNRQNYAFACLQEGMSYLYNLTVSGCDISEFDYVLKAYKGSMADDIVFSETTLKDCNNGIELAAETNDKGDYNTEYLTIKKCQFENIPENVVDYYRGGYDESTIGGNLTITGSTFSNCGSKEANKILLNTRGIINVDINNNTFKNNRVKLVALLWGAKNNHHADNQIEQSGKILVEENLKLTLMY
ncbi:MAG: alginate lyase [Bacteroidetes bacterium]|nr:MAG: alginate lyase [Bacteroidota bacterium]